MHNSKKRYRLAAIGRQAGKSTWAANELLSNSWKKPGSFSWFVSPTFAQAKEQFNRVNNYFIQTEAVFHKNNLSSLHFELMNKSVIEYKSGEVKDRLRGPALNELIIDEVRDQPRELYQLILRPMLTTTKGRASFISTPNGFDSFYDLYCFAKENPDEWDTFSFPSTANPLFTTEEYESARRSMSDKQFRQEILAEFLDLTSGKVYYAFGEKNIRETSPFALIATSPIINRHLPIVVGMDFNLNPMAWCLGQTNSNKWYWFDEIRIENSNTPQASLELVSRLIPFRDAGLLRADPQIVLIGDAAGKAGQRAAAGQSDYDILKDTLTRHGFTFEDRTPDANPLVKDRVNAVNRLCESADGTIALWIHPKCKWLIRDLRQTVWKEGSSQIEKTKDPMLTHLSDSIGYPIHAITPVPDMGSEVGELRVIR